MSGELKVAALNGAELKECDSESSSSSLCMTAADSWDGASCHGEMMAGHGLMCRSTGSDTWHLVGVSAWRRGCGTVGQRPRQRSKSCQTSSMGPKNELLTLLSCRGRGGGRKFYIKFMSCVTNNPNLK